MEDKIEIVTGDMKEAVDIFGAASFHVITMNPPYMTGNHGLVNPGDAKAIARHEITCTLEEMISQASKVLKSKGIDTVGALLRYFPSVFTIAFF